MKKQYAIIGLGRFGRSVALTLSSLGHDVLAIDTSEQAVQAIAKEVTHSVQADARDETVLKALGIRNLDVAVVAIGHDVEANILITVMLKEMGLKYVVVKAQNSLHGKVLERVGADKIVYPEKDMGIRVAHNLVSSNVMDYIELNPEYSIMEIIIPTAFVNKTLGELNLRAKYGLSVLAIRTMDKIIVAPGADATMKEKDVLIILGNTHAFTKLPM
jgi:trk system potassium uptake protein TrkA